MAKVRLQALTQGTGAKVTSSQAPAGALRRGHRATELYLDWLRIA